ncbi:MAG: CHAD domain-containing protein [Bacteroidales bacterium]|nr:MAG: CHAD domain-containing protein [Bacteroidales bacterium]
MAETEKGTFLSDLYDEKIRSFLHFLDKAKKTYEIEDIHQLRVNAKRINAIYQLIESATDLNFKADYHLKPIWDIFKSAGVLREGQVNLQLLQKYELHPDSMMIYNVFLEKSQITTIQKLKKAVKGFDKIAFDHTIGMIRNYCIQIGKKELIGKMDSYIQGKAKFIKQLLGREQTPKNVHKIRMDLKAIDPILSLLCKMNPERYKSNSIVALKETALQIGEWHDRVILIKSVRKLLKNRKEKNKSHNLTFRELIDRIERDNLELLGKISDGLKETVRFILHPPPE